MTFNELHPKDFEVLSKRYETEPRARITNMDAAILIKASLPPPLRRGLVLIDPPFEVKTEREVVLSALQHGYKRFSTGIFMIWYPVKAEEFANGCWPTSSASACLRRSRSKCACASRSMRAGLPAPASSSSIRPSFWQTRCASSCRHWPSAWGLANGAGAASNWLVPPAA